MSFIAFRLLAGAFVVLFFSCRQGYEVRISESSFLKPSVSASGMKPDSASLSISEPYRLDMSGKMNRVLARSAQSMEKGQPESLLGNFVADLCFAIARHHVEKNALQEVDFCVLNNGGLRSSLPQGDLLLRHAFEVMPFDNELVVVEMDGVHTKKVLDYIAEKGGVPVSGLRMSVANGIPSDVYIGEHPFDPAKTYRIVTSDFLAGGGDSMNMFAGATSKFSTRIKVREAIIMYLEESGKQNQTVTARKDGRISK
jgi:2',3'-cyclic-nucleotide 2'-phosphodiesterase (5'-nucleotidase family)